MYNKGKLPGGRKSATGAMIAGVADRFQYNIRQADIYQISSMYSASLSARCEGHRMGCLNYVRVYLMRLCSD